jgi:AcrR family transcriptional regulator
MSDKRPTHRQRQAQATRSLIIEAARALFLERGYTNTTIEAIADQAGVAGSTVYAVFSSKRGILRAIREPWHGQSHIREFLASDQHDTEPAIRLERLARATCLQWETGTEVIAIYRSAAAADSEAAAELAEALEGRRKGLDAFTCSLEPHLRPGMDVLQASAILRALCQAEVYEELVKRSGWTTEAYITWLATALKREILTV